ncbi:type I 3-dehydroquinate dehydratase [Gluconobacter kondonii]|uniref:type I 3-dehydroquinate dehydratase n=1 Tax=Gluconobacter kondonii TaxID=941463 RepID=UPI00197F6DEC|nr:type I 3-dehydroquinate dehydratase [Gluconobacter kondonii]MBN3868468.1 type I 3-dehydroquinate dehydratase [Gluconobacter kondonii]
MNKTSIKTGTKPSILVPVTSAHPDEALEFIKSTKNREDFDIFELRIDCLTNALNTELVVNYVSNALKLAHGKRIVLTFRTAQEGGNTFIPPDDYLKLYDAILNVAKPEFIDIEFNRGRNCVQRAIEIARKNNISIILSSHDFDKTDSQIDLVNRMEMMRKFDVDVVKMATMPNTIHDVLNLMAATATMRSRHPGLSLITMSMGSLGVISRLTGEIFGSDATFGKIDNSSAPGQIDVSLLKTILEKVDIAVG